jgi:hydrogenase 3 maturation protease
MTENSKNILLGVGNSLRGDDGAGSFIANNFSHKNWIVLDGKTAPENCTAVIKREKPDLLVIIDAADINLAPGDFSVIALDKIKEYQLSTHSMPLHLLIEYLTPYCKKIILIGIQPKNIQTSENLTDQVSEGCYKIISILKNNKINSIPVIQ